MKYLQRRDVCVVVAGVFACPAWVVLHASQATLLADTYVTSARPATNYGSLSNLYVNSAATAMLRFDGTALPAGTTSSQIGRATLRVYVNRVNTPGTLAVVPIQADWREAAVTFQTLPPLGTAVDVEAATDEGQYIAFDVTALVKKWADAPTTNFGFALTTGTADVLLDSKESDTTAHPAMLDIVLASGSGAQGPAGPKGDRGDAGAPGAAGLQGPAGPQGAAGTAGAQGIKGDPGGLVYQGSYSAATTYNSSDLVSYAGAAWVSLVANNRGTTPGTDSTRWGLLVPAPTSTGSPLTYRGVYTSLTTYGTNDVVTYAGAAWVSVATANTGNTPGNSAANWAVLVPAATSNGGNPAPGTSLSYQGVYSAATTYAANSVVTYANAAWVSLLDSNKANTPDTSPASWAVLVPAAPANAPVITKNLAFRGAYASTTNYAVNDVVTWQTTAWISLADSNHGNTPDASPTMWTALVPAAIGLPGANGIPGATGPAGPQGERGLQGDAGPQGPAGATGIAGRAGLTYQGMYRSAANYATGDVVQWQGSSYASLTESNHGNTPDSSPANWGLLTSTGAKGDRGDVGPQGIQGSQGTAGPVGPPGERGMVGPIGSAGPQGTPGRDGAQGPPGDRGLKGDQGAPGPVGLTYLGAYSSTTNYAQNDAVTFASQTWLSLQSNNAGQTPGLSPVYWTLLAANGSTGPQGATGVAGPQGATGATGIPGQQGPAGNTGATGSQGTPGMFFQGTYDSSTNYVLHDAVTYAGGTWLSLTASNHGNTPGLNAADWAQLAAPGAAGAQGPAGATGSTGTPGAKGDRGDAGATGVQGNAGPQGPPVTFRGAWASTSAYQTGDAVGYDGASWIATAPTAGSAPGTVAQWSLLAAAGGTGATGVQGAQGPAGAKGDTGASGAPGTQGDSGLLWRGAYNAQTNYAARDAVAFSGSSYVSLAANNVGNAPGAAGVTQWALLAQAGANGARGADGTPGTNGAAATVTVGSVITGAPGSSVAITNSGTASAAQLNFTIPRGDKGDTGVPGSAGLIWRGTWNAATGYVRNDGVALNGTSYLALTANNNSSPAADIANNLGNWAVLAQQGATGANGAATVSIGTVTTGTTATVTNSGTQTAARLDFTLPKGDTGAQGAPGLIWRGAWDSNTQYASNDAVSYSGSAYIAIANSRSTAPTGTSNSTQAWSLLASQGSTGATPTLSVGTTTTGAAGSQASVTLGAGNVFSFTIPRGDKGDTGAAGTGSSGASAGTTFASVHTLAAQDGTAQYYAATTDKTGGSEAPNLLVRMPPACTVTGVNLYNTGAAGLSFELRAGTQPTALTSVIACTGVATGASVCAATTNQVLGGQFVSLRIASATSIPSYLYTTFLCN